MNWGSHSVDAVSKERIWREHVLTEKNTARIHEEFRCNPLKKDPPTAESISKRPARFLDRTAVIMDMLEKRLQRVKKNGGDSSTVDSGRGSIDSGRYVSIQPQQPGSSRVEKSAAQNFALQTRGMYSFNDSSTNKGFGQSQTSPRGMQSKDKLPPLGNTNNSSTNNMTASGRVSFQTNNDDLKSPRTKKQLAAHDFDGLYSQAQLTPREKFAVPQTAMQEIGWWNQNLISSRELEPRFRYGLSSCDVTKNGSAFVGSRKK